MTHQKDRRVGLFGEAHQLGRSLPHLADRAGGGLEQLRVEGLDGVHHHHPRGLGLRLGQDALHAGLGEQPDAGAPEPETPGPQTDLLGGLLAAHIEHRLVRPQVLTGLEQQGRLADPRVAAEQDH